MLTFRRRHYTLPSLLFVFIHVYIHIIEGKSSGKTTGKDLEIFISVRTFPALPEIKDSNTICW